MSLLPTTSHRDPTTPFWAYAGAGGGAVSSIIAGPGISVDTPTGNVTITNTGGSGTSVDTAIGEFPTIGSVPSGIDQYATEILGTIDFGKFYPQIDNFYTAGISVIVSGVSFSSETYEGNLTLLLSYIDGSENIVAIGTQSVYIADVSNVEVSQYCFSLTVGFKAQTDFTLKLALVNGTTGKINSLNYAISNFYTLNTGAVGDTGNTIFV